MHPHVRGGLGFQILGLIGAMSESIENHDPISGLTLNFGHYPNANAYAGKFKYDHDYLSYFFNLDFPITKQIGTEKYPFFRPYVIRRVIQHLSTIRERLPIRPQYLPPYDTTWTAIHVRHLDRIVVSDTVYQHIIDEQLRCFIMTDDYEAAWNKFSPNTPISTNQEHDDWLSLSRIVNPRFVIGGVSSFTISAALLNPLLHLQIVSRRDSLEGPLTDLDWESVTLLTELVPNISFYSRKVSS
jgi:hypothetical protein